MSSDTKYLIYGTPSKGKHFSKEIEFVGDEVIKHSSYDNSYYVNFNAIKYENIHDVLPSLFENDQEAAVFPSQPTDYLLAQLQQGKTWHRRLS